MKVFRSAVLGLFMALSGLSATNAYADGNEIVDRGEVQQEAIDLFVQQNWQQLDALIEKYRSAPYAATSGGAQKLVLVYAGIRKTFGSSGKMGEEAADQWIAANPNSAAAYALKASMIEARATQLRGEGPMSTVNPAILPEYKTLLAQATKTLLDNKKIADSDPNWYSQIIMLSKLQGDADARWKWLKEGSERFPYYQSLYLEAMIGALPKWGGSPEEIEKIARLAAEKTKDQAGLSLYTYVWYNALSSQPELTALLAQRQIFNWEDMRQGWDDRLKLYPSAWSRNGYLTSACLAGDKATFTTQKAQLGGSQNVFNQLWLRGTSYNECERRMR